MHVPEAALLAAGAVPTEAPSMRQAGGAGARGGDSDAADLELESLMATLMCS